MLEREHFWFQAQPQLHESLKMEEMELSHYLQTLAAESPQQLITNNEKWEKLKKSKENSVKPATEVARKRRQKIAEKLRCLQKLLPWNTKMDTATMLGEAANYIKFLQAQISVLSSMPLYTSPSSSASEAVGMDSLNREQVLSLMLNSPEAQTVLSRNGCCLYTVEQMAELLNNKVAVTGRPPDDVLPAYLLDEMHWNY